MNEGAATELTRRLREAGSEELEGLLERHLEELRPPAAGQVLRNPHLTTRGIELLLSRPVLMAAYDVRSELAAHPRTPEAAALRLVAGLYWRDLVSIGKDVRVRPTVRRAADRTLGERLPGLAVGEKAAIARGGGPGVLARLRHDPSPRVIAALLENPRLTEGILGPLVTSEQALPQVLAVIAASGWGLRYPIRVALSRNRRTPVDTALALLPSLKKRDLDVVACDHKLPVPVRRRAQLLSGR
jgi:hypothetical protein